MPGENQRLDALLETRDAAYSLFRRLVIDVTDDGLCPPRSMMSTLQLVATLELEAAERALTQFREQRAESQQAPGMD